VNKLKTLVKKTAIYASIVISAFVMSMLYFETTSYIRHNQRDKARATRCVSAVMRLALAENAHYANYGKFVEVDILANEGYVSKAELKNRFRDKCLISGTQDGVVYNEEPGKCWP
jgi:hypothetical protein